MVICVSEITKFKENINLKIGFIAWHSKVVCEPYGLN